VDHLSGSALITSKLSLGGLVMANTVFRKKNVLKKWWIDFSFLLPALLLVCVFVCYPILYGVPLSFTKWDGFSAEKAFNGLDNYIRIFRDTNVSGAMGNTLLFTLYTVVLTNGIGLFAAILFQKTSKLNNLSRTALFMPYMLSLVLSGYIVKYIYTDLFFNTLGMTNPLTNKGMVMFGLSVIAIWRDAGYCMVIYYAALKCVPEELYDSCKIEGANAIRKFIHITLPLIVPALTANLTLTLSWALKVFDYPMVTTMGGPGSSSVTMNMLIYRNIFVNYKAGYGQAQAVIFTLFIFLATGLVAKLLRSQEVEF
jgi:ABC-type sugar transport system permease subunit